MDPKTLIKFLIIQNATKPPVIKPPVSFYRVNPICQIENTVFQQCSGCVFKNSPSCDDPQPMCIHLRICIPGCQCKPGFIRKSKYSTECVPENTCHRQTHQYLVGRPSYHVECKKNNETFSMCQGHCQPSCKTPVVYCNRMCISGCVCKNGYTRDDNGVCIPENKCVN